MSLGRLRQSFQSLLTGVVLSSLIIFVILKPTLSRIISLSRFFLWCLQLIFKEDHEPTQKELKLILIISFINLKLNDVTSLLEKYLKYMM